MWLWHCLKSIGAFSFIATWLSYCWMDLLDNPRDAPCVQQIYSLLLNLPFGITASHLRSISNVQLGNKIYWLEHNRILHKLEMSPFDPLCQF